MAGGRRADGVGDWFALENGKNEIGAQSSSRHRNELLLPISCNMKVYGIKRQLPHTHPFLSDAALFCARRRIYFLVCRRLFARFLLSLRRIFETRTMRCGMTRATPANQIGPGTIRHELAGGVGSWGGRGGGRAWKRQRLWATTIPFPSLQDATFRFFVSAAFAPRSSSSSSDANYIEGSSKRGIKQRQYLVFCACVLLNRFAPVPAATKKKSGHT